MADPIKLPPLPEPVTLYHRPSFLAGEYIYITGHTPDQMQEYAAAVSAAKDARIKVLEDALRHVNKCLSINDYGDYVLLSLFDAEIVRTALGDKP